MHFSNNRQLGCVGNKSQGFDGAAKSVGAGVSLASAPSAWLAHLILTKQYLSALYITF
jgi:hypothetical protein